MASSCAAASLCWAKIASCLGVRPCSHFIVASAPASRRAARAALAPTLAAACRGVMPSQSRASTTLRTTSLPLSFSRRVARHRITFPWPRCAACQSGPRPRASLIDASAPASNRMAQASASPDAARTHNGVARTTPWATFTSKPSPACATRALRVARSGAAHDFQSAVSGDDAETGARASAPAASNLSTASASRNRTAKTRARSSKLRSVALNPSSEVMDALRPGDGGGVDPDLPRSKAAARAAMRPPRDGVAGVTVPDSSSDTWRGSSCELSISESRASSSRAALTAFLCAR
mmetsp:Transcript_23444/g.65741  ORF Transcript_23444/g.65741 Transcript_23444/m.65741 type:complete len:293 (+) Transcript_23444:383-1261(+)